MAVCLCRQAARACATNLLRGSSQAPVCTLTWVLSAVPRLHTPSPCQAVQRLRECIGAEAMQQLRVGSDKQARLYVNTAQPAVHMPVCARQPSSCALTRHDKQARF